MKSGRLLNFRNFASLLVVAACGLAQARPGMVAPDPPDKGTSRTGIDAGVRQAVESQYRSSGVAPPQKRLSAQEQAELRRQLLQFNRQRSPSQDFPGAAR